MLEVYRLLFSMLLVKLKARNSPRCNDYFKLWYSWNHLQYVAFSQHHKRSLYDVLQISPKATQAEVKAAYFRLSKTYHPDVNPAADAKTKFAELTDAYDIIGNVRKRHMYDSATHRHSPLDSSPSNDQMYDEMQLYREKIRQKFKARHERRNASGPMRTKFNFDEFYREHYPEELTRQRMEKAMNSNKVEEEQDAKAEAYTRLYAFLATVCGLTGLFLISDSR